MADIIEPADETRKGIYEWRATFADKWLGPDGSIYTGDGTLVEGPDQYRAEAYSRRAAIAAKFLLPDGSIVFALPGGGEGGGNGTINHTLLINRDAADQHPVSAITGLDGRLDGFADGIAELKPRVDDNETAISNLSQVIPVTYTDLAALKTAGNLVPGQRYLITDYSTKYQQPVSNKIVTCDVEQLTVTAESTNRFSPIAFSAAHPMDTIWYSFDDNRCENNSTARTGFILRRYDPVRRINLPWDWRSIKWARFKVDTSAMETWEEGAAVVKGTFYITGTSISKALNSGTPTSVTDSSYFVEFVPNYETNYWLYNSAYGLPRSSEYAEYYTFDQNGTNDHANTTITNILIEGGANGYRSLTNSLWRYTVSTGRPYSIFAAAGFENNSFGATCYGNTFGSNCHGNTFGSTCHSNTLGSTCRNNNFGNIFAHNELKDGADNKDFSTITELHGKAYNHTISRRADGKFVASWLNATNTPQYLVVE